MDTVSPHAENGNSPSTEDLAYLAGIIDGEGCIDIHNDNRFRSLYPRLRIEMAERGTIEWIQLMFPGSKVQVINRPNINYSTTYRWTVQGQPAIDLLKLLMPYLRGKREQAELLLQFPYPGYKINQFRPVPSEMYARRLELFYALRACKTKGKGLIKYD